MKNLYLLPTQNNNSKLASYTYDESKNVKIGEIGLNLGNSSGWTNCWSPRELYITSDEDIGEGDWMYYKHFGEDILTKYNSYGGQNTNVNEHKDYYKKIILSTDLDLIKDGVQKIKDDFLQWFIHNSSCEHIDVKQFYSQCMGECGICDNSCGNWYKIIIPSKVDNLESGQIISKQHKCLDCNKLISDCSCIEQIVEFPKQGVDIKEFERKAIEIIDNVGKQEQKQHLIDIMKDDEELGVYEETVEEAAQSYAKIVNQNHTSHMLGFLNGAKWAQKKSQSEKELLNILQHRDAHMNNYHKLWGGFQTPKEWLEHFKNK